MEYINNLTLKQAALNYVNNKIKTDPIIKVNIDPVMILMSVKTEIFFVKEKVKVVSGYEGQYAVTSLGRICNYTKNNIKWFSFNRTTAYVRLGLVKDKSRKYFHLHRLVADAFIANTESKPAVNHIDCNKHHNSVNNLEWVTCKENWEHARDHGRVKGKILDPEKKLELQNLYRTGYYTYSQLATLYDISCSSAYRYANKIR